MANIINKAKIKESVFFQLISFIFIGAICFLIDISFLYFLREIISFNVYIAAIISFTTATYVNYLLNLEYVFIGGKHKKKKEIIYFFLVALISLILTLLIMYLFIDIFNVYYLLAKIITVFIVSFFSFFMRKTFVFIS